MLEKSLGGAGNSILYPLPFFISMKVDRQKRGEGEGEGSLNNISMNERPPLKYSFKMQ